MSSCNSNVIQAVFPSGKGCQAPAGPVTALCLCFQVPVVRGEPLPVSLVQVPPRLHPRSQLLLLPGGTSQDARGRQGHRECVTRLGCSGLMSPCWSRKPSPPPAPPFPSSACPALSLCRDLLSPLLCQAPRDLLPSSYIPQGMCDLRKSPRTPGTKGLGGMETLLMHLPQERKRLPTPGC